jgi:AcrR family transcriptional regulator
VWSSNAVGLGSALRAISSSFRPRARSPTVTTRRLADTIEYSQPVLYSHFANKDAIVAAVAIQGFTELAERLHQARLTAAKEQQALAGLAQAYLDFGLANPALYDAMSGLTWVYRLVRPKHHERSTPGSRSYAPR